MGEIWGVWESKEAVKQATNEDEEIVRGYHDSMVRKLIEGRNCARSPDARKMVLFTSIAILIRSKTPPGVKVEVSWMSYPGNKGRIECSLASGSQPCLHRDD